MRLLTVKEVAALIKAKPSTIYSWAEQRILPAIKLNGLLRFDEADILEFILKKKEERSYNTTVGGKPRKGGQN